MFDFPVAGKGRVNAMQAVERGFEEPLFFQLVNKVESEGQAYDGVKHEHHWWHGPWPLVD